MNSFQQITLMMTSCAILFVLSGSVIAQEKSQPVPPPSFTNPSSDNVQDSEPSENIPPVTNSIPSKKNADETDQTKQQVPMQKDDATENPNNTTPKRDPFSVTPKMLQKAARGTPGVGNQQFRASLPNMEMIGFAEDGIRPAIALVKISNDEVLFIRENDSLYLPSGKGYLKLKVAKIDRMGVLVEIEDSAETVWIH